MKRSRTSFPWLLLVGLVQGVARLLELLRLSQKFENIKEIANAEISWKSALRYYHCVFSALKLKCYRNVAHDKPFVLLVLNSIKLTELSVDNPLT